MKAMEAMEAMEVRRWMWNPPGVITRWYDLWVHVFFFFVVVVVVGAGTMGKVFEMLIAHRGALPTSLLHTVGTG